MIRLLFLLLGVILASILSTVYGAEALDRVPASSPRLENIGGNQVSQNVIVNQLVQVTADVTNNQEISQDFVYIVQIKDESGVIRYLAWISGTLQPGQSFSAARSWTPDTSGKFVAEIFVWESFSNPDPLSNSVSLTITAS
ncbi:MAG TPA: hypothetical protein VFG25_05695 [Nitrosopumilaceae archaeon]|nr:hypothetical protein [Nitrosopumilaceae archaeon]